jgi:hypothetical protein
VREEVGETEPVALGVIVALDEELAHPGQNTLRST